MAKLYRKDFEELARLLKRARPTAKFKSGPDDLIDGIADDLAGFLAGTNTSFNRQRFLEATREDSDG